MCNQWSDMYITFIWPWIVHIFYLPMTHIIPEWILKIRYQMLLSTLRLVHKKRFRNLVFLAGQKVWCENEPKVCPNTISSLILNKSYMLRLICFVIRCTFWIRWYLNVQVTRLIKTICTTNQLYISAGRPVLELNASSGQKGMSYWEIYVLSMICPV